MGNLLKYDPSEPPQEPPYLLLYALAFLAVAGFLLCMFLGSCRASKCSGKEWRQYKVLKTSPGKALPLQRG